MPIIAIIAIIDKRPLKPKILNILINVLVDHLREGSSDFASEIRTKRAQLFTKKPQIKKQASSSSKP